jgi:predicted transcriptional regulator
MGAKRPAVSDTELDVLKALWDTGGGTVREVNARLRQRGRRWAYTTVQTLLHRLEAKGYARRDASAAAHVFRAAVSREQLLKRRLRELADDLCKGTATPLMLALVEDQRLSPEDIARLRQLLDDLDPSADRAE